eukprot:1315038-Amphidinium_carterae.1
MRLAGPAQPVEHPQPKRQAKEQYFGKSGMLGGHANSRETGPEANPLQLGAARLTKSQPWAPLAGSTCWRAQSSAGEPAQQRARLHNLLWAALGRRRTASPAQLRRFADCSVIVSGLGPKLGALLLCWSCRPFHVGWSIRDEATCDRYVGKLASSASGRWSEKHALCTMRWRLCMSSACSKSASTVLLGGEGRALCSLGTPQKSASITGDSALVSRGRRWLGFESLGQLLGPCLRCVLDETVETYAAAQLAWLGIAPWLAKGLLGALGGSPGAHTFGQSFGRFFAFPEQGEECRTRYGSAALLQMAMHPGGKLMHERAGKLALHLEELWVWIARQESLVAEKEFRDCDEVTVRSVGRHDTQVGRAPHHVCHLWYIYGHVRTGLLQKESSYEVLATAVA